MRIDVSIGMRSVIRSAVGTVFLIVGVAGLVVLGVGPREVLQLEVTRLAMRAGLLTPSPPPVTTPLTADEVRDLTQSALGSAEPHQADTAPPPGSAPAAARLRIPAIKLDSEVVPARLVRLPTGVVTWEVPAHRVGHAQGTTPLGEPGNAVLLGHVSSINAGNVFAQLDRVRAGDEVVAGSDGKTVYRVTDRRLVTRDDMSVMAPVDGAVATLITCAGTWLPAESDYSHRLIVRAVLITT